MKNKAEIDSLVINSEKVIGTKQVLRSLIAGALRCVVVSEDCDGSLKNKIAEACRESEVELRSYPSMKELGKLCGIEVSAATVGLLKQ